jgi:hypothetical protein
LYFDSCSQFSIWEVDVQEGEGDLQETEILVYLQETEILVYLQEIEILVYLQEILVYLQEVLVYEADLQRHQFLL